MSPPATLEARGEFYTPEVIAEGKPVSISDPCIGSGGMILAIARHFTPDNAVDLLRFSGTDVSPVACDMSFLPRRRLTRVFLAGALN